MRVRSGALVPSLTFKPFPSTAEEILIKTVLKASKWPLLLFQEPEVLANLVIIITKQAIRGAQRMLNTLKDFNRSPSQLLQSHNLHQERSIIDLSFIGTGSWCFIMLFLTCTDWLMWFISIFGEELLPYEGSMPSEFFRSI